MTQQEVRAQFIETPLENTPTAQILNVYTTSNRNIERQKPRDIYLQCRICTCMILVFISGVVLGLQNQHELQCDEYTSF